MDEKLKNDLGILLANHPELKNSNLVFTESDFAFACTINPCEITEPFPGIIAGHSHKIEARMSPIHGYGVFAKERIENGELVEQCKLLKLGRRGKYNNDPVLKDYVWANGKCGCEECKKHGANQYIALGMGSLYNHANNHNTKLNLDFKTETMAIRANGAIEKDQEIFVNYGKRYWATRGILKSINQNRDWYQFFENKANPGTIKQG